MKYSPIFITATNTDVGKTYTTLKLLEALSAKGLKVGVMKPIETGVIDANPLDATLLFERAKELNPELKALKLKDIVPYQFELAASPFVAKGRKKIDTDVLMKAYEKIASFCDIVLIEGAGGLLVPIDDELFMYDFIRLFEAKTLLVGDSKLGCINDILLNLHLLDSLGVQDYEWCVNLRGNKEEFSKITMPFLKKMFGEVLFVQEDLSEIVKRLVASSNIYADKL